MAITFKNNIDLENNQILNLGLEQQATDGDVGGVPVQGQLYFNTTSQQMKIYNTVGGVAAWRSITGDVTSVTSTTIPQLVTTNPNGPDVTIAVVLGSIANGATNLVTSDVIFDYIETLDPVLSVSAGAGIVLTGTSDNVTVNVDYSGASNVINDASDGTGVGLATTDRIIFNDASDNVVKYATLSQLNTSDFHPTLAQVLAKGNTTSGTDIAVSTGDDITFVDSAKAIFGNSDDLSIFHNSADSFIIDNSGDLKLASTNIRLLRPGLGEFMANFFADGANEFYFDGTKRLETTNDGVKITGGLQDKDGELGTAGQYLSSTGSALDWITLPTFDNYEYWTATDDGGNTHNVTTKATFDFDAGAGITAVVGAGTVVITNTDLGSAQLFFKTFNASSGDDVVANSNDDTMAVDGTANQLVVTGDNTAASQSLTFSLPNATFASGNQLILPGQASLAATPPSGDSSLRIATTAFVQDALTGLLEFKGGFRADTGEITSGDNNGSFLYSNANRVAIAVGDYYVASGSFSGNFYGDAAYPLTPGDSVICNTASAANASVVGDWSVVQSDTDLANATTIGIGNVKPLTNTLTGFVPTSMTADYNGSGTAFLGVAEASTSQAGAQIVVGTAPIVATYTGSSTTRTVTLSYDSANDPMTASVPLTATGVAYVSRAESGGFTTYGVTVTNAAVFGGGNGTPTALTTAAEVITTAGETVYAEITRSGAVISFVFAGTVNDAAFIVLLSRIS